VSDSLRSSEGKAGSADTSSKTARDDATRPGRDSQDIKATGGKSEREGSAPLAAELARSATARIEDNTVASEIGAQHAQTDADALEVKEQRETSLAVASAPQVAAQESDARESWEASEFEAQIETRFGGLFFLINLALFLDLYGDFTAPNAPCLPLPVWDFVALVGRELAGARVESDPLWSLLARLAGRAGGVEPGEGFEPADVWHVSVEWLKTFPTAGVWLWSAAGGRLRVRHPAGFFVIDAVLERDGTQRQLAREMRPYLEACPGVRLRRVAKHFRVRGHNARERWLTRLTEYVRARLFRALGVGESRELSHLVCERRARVFVTAAHLDVVMRLVELPVAVRFAGLDRDPGWLPVAGRHVAFHFE
jgi:hypothetical protein